jgi:transcriptional regulator with GAF, ATPase, and Fis domain
MALLTGNTGRARTAAAAGAIDSSKDFSSLDSVCARHIRQALDRSRGKISGPGGAAELLKLHPNTLRQRMDKLNIAYRRRHQQNQNRHF